MIITDNISRWCWFSHPATRAFKVTTIVEVFIIVVIVGNELTATLFALSINCWEVQAKIIGIIFFVGIRFCPKYELELPCISYYKLTHIYTIYKLTLHTHIHIAVYLNFLILMMWSLTVLSLWQSY